MSKLTLSDISGGYSAPAKTNANNALIEAALENTLSRDGTAPNQMEADFDMNGFQIINLGSPQSPTAAARLVDITGLITLTGMPIPSVTGNEGKLLFTDGTNLYWGDVEADSLPLFTSTDRGAVPNSPSMLATVLLWGDGAWATPASRNIPLTNAATTYTRAQRHQFSTVTFGGTSTIDTSLSNQYKLTLTGNSTIAFGGTPVNGTNFTLVLIQDGTGGRTVTWPTIDWVDGAEPTLAVGADEFDLIKLRYDGTTWFGEHQGPNATESTDPEDFDLAITHNEENVDVFRRLGSPLSAGTYTVLIADGVVVSSRSVRDKAMSFAGAFASGSVINVTNRGFIIGKGGRGADASVLTAATGVVWAIGYNGEAGGDAIEGPPTGVTVNITNAAGRLWGGGGGGGSGGASADDAIASGGAGGGGAGGGQGGKGANMKMSGDTFLTTCPYAQDGGLGLDDSDSGGDGAAGDGNGSSGDSGADGGDGGDYGEAGENGAAAVDQTNLIIGPGTGGAAGRAVTAGYAGTLNIVSGGSSPNVKGAL